MRFKRKIDLGKEEIGEIKGEIEEKNNYNIKKNELIKDNKGINKSKKSASPIISIITPYYNGQDYIEETAYSVLNQTFTNFEWIIVDDGSSREGKEKLKEIQKLDDRINVINTENIKNDLVTNEELVQNARTKKNRSQMHGQKRTGPKCTRTKKNRSQMHGFKCTDLRERETWE